MSMRRSSLGQVRGLGAAKTGASFFWWQRISGLALVPLALWFVASVIALAGADYQHFRAWIGVPGNATLMVLTVFAVFYHAQLGLQVVIEDYLHKPAAKFALLILVKFVAVVSALFSAVAVCRVAFLGG
jgi:succinate dehydrogenase / fumarate reductase membrane anchor subunit